MKPKELAELTRHLHQGNQEEREKARKQLIAIKKKAAKTGDRETREAVIEAMRWRRTFDVTLPSGQTVKVSMSHTVEQVDRKVKILYGYKNDKPDWRNVRDKDGEFVTAPVPVQGMRISVRFTDGTKLVARACCKSPDVFTVKTAKRRAMRRIDLLDSGVDPFVIQKDDNGQLIKTLKDAPKKPRLDGQDRRALFFAVLRNGRPLKVKTKKLHEEGSLAMG